MKRALLFFLTILFVQSAFSQDEETINGPHIVFEETSFDFGDIHQGDKVEHIFSFQNQGTEPLLLSNVATTCGCTAPSWPREPIPPGETGEIKVVFNSAGKMGRQNKIITVFSNATQNMTRVKIISNVLPPKKDETGG